MGHHQASLEPLNIFQLFLTVLFVSKAAEPCVSRGWTSVLVPFISPPTGWLPQYSSTLYTTHRSAWGTKHEPAPNGYTVNCIHFVIINVRSWSFDQFFSNIYFSTLPCVIVSAHWFICCVTKRWKCKGADPNSIAHHTDLHVICMSFSSIKKKLKFSWQI
jgi:hypothetical protein